MNLEKQLQILIQEAPQYGVPSEIMQQGVTPILKQFANDLEHLEYFICQNSNQDWLLTTLSHRTQPNLEKKVIYAFSTLEDAIQMQGLFNEETVPISIPVTQLIFQLFALPSVDSIIFMDIPGNLAKGKEITKTNLFELLQLQLQQLKNTNIPPNLA